MTAIFLLLGMLMFAQYMEREQYMVRILRFMLKSSQGFSNYLFRVSIICFIFSAIFTNDACCTIFTPLFLKFWEAQERPNIEIDTLALAIATTSNIGSVLTIFGNPHMALIAAFTAYHKNVSFRFDMRSCF